MAEKECGVLTLEALERAAERALESGRPPERIVSYKASRILKKIRHKIPGWDSWVTESEIWFKAYKLGITEDE